MSMSTERNKELVESFVSSMEKRLTERNHK